MLQKENGGEKAQGYACPQNVGESILLLDILQKAHSMKFVRLFHQRGTHLWIVVWT